MTSAVSSCNSRSILTYATVDSFEAERGAMALALSVCTAMQACLTGVLLDLEANMPPSVTSLNFAQMCEQSELREKRNTQNAQALEAKAAERGIPIETLTGIDHSRGVIGFLADHARLHDLLVIGADGAGLMSDRMIAENVLFESGRPMLVAPADFAGPFSCKKMVVAWDNSRVAARAMGDALALFPQVQEIVMIVVGDEKTIQSSLTASDVEQTLARRGLSAKVQHVLAQARPVGDVLQAQAEAVEADMLVMGGFAHSRLRDFILGGATLSVLKAPRVPVLLSH